MVQTLGCESAAAARASRTNRPRLGIGGELGRQKLERHRAFELGVFGLVDDAHTSAAKGFKDAKPAGHQSPRGDLFRRSHVGLGVGGGPVNR